MKKLMLIALLLTSCGGETEKKPATADSTRADTPQTHHGHHHGGSANEYMNQSSFEDLVKRFEGPERDAYQDPEKVLQYLGDLKGKTVMDIGAGTGYFSFRFAKAGAKVIAADVEQKFQDFIRDKMKTEAVAPGEIQLRLIPYDSPQLSKGEADLVVIVNTYHHIENRVEYFKQVLDGLKPNGELVVIDFFKRDLPVGPPVEHKLSEEEVIKELKLAGFNRFEVNSRTLKYQYMLKARTN